MEHSPASSGVRIIASAMASAAVGEAEGLGELRALNRNDMATRRQEGDRVLLFFNVALIVRPMKRLSLFKGKNFPSRLPSLGVPVLGVPNTGDLLRSGGRTPQRSNVEAPGNSRGRCCISDDPTGCRAVARRSSPLFPSNHLVEARGPRGRGSGWRMSKSFHSIA